MHSRIGFIDLMARDEGSNKSISLPDNGFYELWMVRVVVQRLSYLSNRCINAAFGVKKYVLSPKLGNNLCPGDKSPAVCEQKKQKL